MAVQEITRRLAEYECELITTRLSRDLPVRERIGAVVVHRVGLGFGGAWLNKVLSPFWGALKALQLMRAGRVDAFWAIMVTYTSGAAYIANILRFWDPVSIVLTLQEGDSEAHLTERHGGLIHFAWKLALRRASFLTAISTHLKDRASRLGYTGHAIIIPNGVDVARFGHPATFEAMDECRERLGFTKDKRIVITAGRLVHKNGVDLIIKALPYLPEHVVFVSLGDGKERGALITLSERCAVADRVRLLPFVTHEELPIYLQLADVFVRPSRSEGMGNAFIEAMMSKTPVVGTAVGGIPDFLTDNETGLIAMSDNPKSIAEKIMLLLEDHALRAAVVERAFILTRERYGWDRIAHDMKTKVFDRLAA